MTHYVRCVLCLFSLAAPALAVESPQTSLTAVLLPDGRYSMAALRAMERETAHILKASGVKLRWRLDGSSEVSNGLLVVVMLHGRCDMDGSAAQFKPGPLGWSHEADGSVLPFSDLACDSIRGAVQGAWNGQNRKRGNDLLGRAMGRVLAHELYHVVADTAAHGRDGVAQASFTPRDLTRGQFQLERPDAAAVRNGLLRSR